MTGKGEKGSRRTAPRGACKYHHALLAREPAHDVEAITRQPEDFASDAIQLCIVLCARERLGIFLDGEHAVPAAGACEGNGIAAYAGEGVDDDGARSGRGFGNVCCDFTLRRRAASVAKGGKEGGGGWARGKGLNSLCDGFGRYAEPGVFGHPDAFIVLLPDFEALEPVPATWAFF